MSCQRIEADFELLVKENQEQEKQAKKLKFNMKSTMKEW